MKPNLKVKISEIIKQYDSHESHTTRPYKTSEIKRDILLYNGPIAFQMNTFIQSQPQENEVNELSKLSITYKNSVLDLPYYKKETPNLNKLKASIKHNKDQEKLKNQKSSCNQTIHTNSKLNANNLKKYNISEKLNSSGQQHELKSLETLKRKIMINREDIR